MRRWRGMVAAGVLAVGVLSPPGTAGAESAPVLSGQVTGSNGAPLGGATVEVAVVPAPTSRAAALVPEVVASVTADEAGRYAVDEIPGLEVGRGPVELQVTASKARQAVHHVMTVDADDLSQGTREGAAALGTLDLRLEAGATSDPQRLALVEGEGEVETTDDVPADADGQVAPTGGASSCAGTYMAVWVPQYDVLTKRMVPIHRLTARQHSRMRYLYDTTKRTEMTVAFTGDGGSYMGGLTGSKEQDTSLGFLHKIGNGDSELLKIQWEYMRYRKKCVQSWTGGNTYYLDVYQWRPYRKTAGSATLASEPPWDCAEGSTVSMAVDTWVARTAKVRWVGWFSLGGSKMDALQENSEDHKFTVLPDPGERDPRVCGSDDVPAEADRVKERVD